MVTDGPVGQSEACSTTRTISATMSTIAKHFDSDKRDETIRRLSGSGLRAHLKRSSNQTCSRRLRSAGCNAASDRDVLLPHSWQLADVADPIVWFENSRGS